jgi:hypothetical protein
MKLNPVLVAIAISLCRQKRKANVEVMKGVLLNGDK